MTIVFGKTLGTAPNEKKQSKILKGFMMKKDVLITKIYKKNFLKAQKSAEGLFNPSKQIIDLSDRIINEWVNEQRQLWLSVVARVSPSQH